MLSSIKSNYKSVLSWLPSILVMIIIFSFSSSVADDSSRTSLGLTERVIYVIEHIADISIEEGSVAYNTVHHIVRKAGHFLEFMALGCTFVLPYSLIIKRKWLVFILSEMSSVFYACTDEFHQLFVEGRSGNLKDVGIDSTGALVGVCTGFIIWFILGIICRRRSGRRRLKI